MSPEQRAALRALDGLVTKEVPPEPARDGDYWRGALAVIAERHVRIEADVVTHNRALFDLETARGLARKAQRDAVLQSRNVLTRNEVARILGITAGSVTRLLNAELRRQGMGRR